MCAISGIINKLGFDVNPLYLKEMSDRMTLRGPDRGDLFVNNNVGIAHRRLSIIDLKTGDQPMAISNGDIIIVFNGEIYNYREIKDELVRRGLTFDTTSDTEVVAKAYEYYGIDKCLKQLEGMFAFAIYDRRDGNVFIARDRYGEKPLYYYENDDSFFFASELKAFKPSLDRFQIDKTALNLFLALSYIPAPYTIYENIKKLLPGHYLRVYNGRIVDNVVYYDLRSDTGLNYAYDYETAKKELRSILEDSVRMRMVSDVPMGAFLSGGIDSSIICCLMNKLSNVPINTFSIGYEEKDYDESERAKIVAKHIGANHKIMTLKYSDALESLDELISYYDEPFGDSSAIPSYYVAKLARENVKVVLTGDCADELFAGYDKYLAEYYVRRYKKVPLPIRKVFEYLVSKIPVNTSTNMILRKMKKVMRNSKCSGFDLYFNLVCLGFNEKDRMTLLGNNNYVDIRTIYKDKYSSLLDTCTYLQKEQTLDVMGVLEGCMLPKVDRACMHCSLESRNPFIDSRIVKLALNIKDDYKLDGKNKKKILKDAFSDILPKETLSFSKKGFGIPIEHWFRKELRPELERLLSKDTLKEQGLFNYEFVNTLLNQHLSGTENNKGMLWNLFVFQKWYFNNISKS